MNDSFDFGTGAIDRAWCVAAAPDGYAVFGGEQWGGPFGAGPTWVVRGHTPGGGAAFWSHTLNGTGNGADIARGAAADPNDNFYVAGQTSVTGEGLNWQVIKYDVAGNRIWTRTLNGGDNVDDSA